MRAYAIDDVRAGRHPRALWDPQAPPVFGTPYEKDQNLGPNSDADPFATAEAAKKNPALEPRLPYVPSPNDVTAAFWHLMRQSELSPEHFICPASGRRPFEFPAGTTKMHYTNWPGHAALREHLSFSFHNMYFSIDGVGRGAKWADTLSATHVLVADMNPGNEALLQLTTADVPEPDALGPDAGSEVKPYNSPNHFGYGQNILHADGAVRFVLSPLVGPKRDNIYTYRGSGVEVAGEEPLGSLPSAGIIGPGFDAHDNILLPTAELLKQQAPKMPTEQEAQRANESEPWRREILQRYQEARRRRGSE